MNPTFPQASPETQSSQNLFFLSYNSSQSQSQSLFPSFPQQLSNTQQSIFSQPASYPLFSQSTPNPLSRSLSYSAENLSSTEDDITCSQKTNEHFQETININNEQKESLSGSRKKLRINIKNDYVDISKGTSFDPRCKVEIPNFQFLPPGKSCLDRNYSIAQSQENMEFNRYPDVLPENDLIYAPISCIYQGDTIELSPYYLNAVKIPIQIQGKSLSYVATQAPKENTFNEFWKAIVVGGSDTIFCLAMVLENNKIKCDDYWSDEYWKDKDHISITHGDLFLGSLVKKDEEVIFTSKISNERIVKRSFEFTPDGEEDGRIITQYHFENWPDNGIPEDLELLEIFVSLVPADESKGPPVFHCSAGIGRTGTFIAIDALLKELQAQIEQGCALNIDPVKIVETMRFYREGMVQKPEQFKLIYEILFRFGEKIKQSGKQSNNLIYMKI
jgi:protein tyrosine phosphatase